MTGRAFIIDLSSLGMANVFGKLLWALSLAIAMRLLGPDAYGQLVVIWSVAGILAPLTDLGLSSLLLREGARSPVTVGSLSRWAFAIRLVLGTMVVGLLALGVIPLSVSLPASVIVLAALGPVVDGLFLTITAIAQVEQRVRLLAAWRIIGMATLPLLLLAASDALTVSGAAAAWVIASAGAMIGFFSTRAFRGKELINDTKVAILPALRSSLPFLLLGAASMSYGKLEVVVLGQVAGSREAALYHSAYQLILLAFSCADILFTVLNAHLFRARANPQVLAARWPPISRLLCTITALSAPVLWWNALPIMTLIGGPDFARAAEPLRALVPMLLVLPMAAALHFLVLLDRPIERAAFDTSCVVLTAILGLWSARWGAAGMAWTASGVYVSTCLAAWLRARQLGIELEWISNYVKVLLAAIAAAWLFWLPLPWFVSTVLYPTIVMAILLGTRFLKMVDFSKLAPSIEGDV